MESLSNYLRKIAEKVSGRAITFLGTGPSNAITDRSGKSNRNNTSTLITYKGKNYRIDVPPDLDTKTNFDYLLITHTHSDAWDGFKKISKKKFVFGIPVSIDRKIELKEDPWEKQKLRIDRQNNFGDLKITPFDVIHDIVDARKFPTLGYQVIFKDGFTLVYASDLLKIPEKSEQFFEKIDLLIIGGAGWNADLSAHIGIWTFLDLVKQKKWNIKKIYFNQIGRPVPDFEDAQRQIDNRYPGMNAKLSYDGLKINF
jgi:phosphoribosyl 1,2-cyclic phosphodiesterase